MRECAPCSSSPNIPSSPGGRRWREVDSPVGPLDALIPPVTIAGVDPVMNRIPAVGEHTDTILGELGFDAATIAAWHRDSMI